MNETEKTVKQFSLYQRVALLLILGSATGVMFSTYLEFGVIFTLLCLLAGSFIFLFFISGLIKTLVIEELNEEKENQRV